MPGDVFLENEHISVSISDVGLIRSIRGSRQGVTHAVAYDTVGMVTDSGTVGPDACPLVERNVAAEHARYSFRSPDGYDLVVQYTLPPGRSFIERGVIVTNVQRPVTLQRIDFGETRFASPPSESIVYDTFWQCPTVTFLRWEWAGLFMGIENPFFETVVEGDGIRQSFQPAQLLQPGDVYECEPQFLGTCRPSGVRLADYPPRTVLGRRPRFFNPCGHIPLDREEIRAMQRFATEYLAVPTRRFHFILYNFFFPLPRMPRAGSPEEALYVKMIDTFKALGGDLAILNPMYEHKKPEGRLDGFWDLAPQGTAAAAVLHYAQQKGIGCGFYMGSAFHGEESSGAALPFAPELSEWKKVDGNGSVAGENCMACDEYAEWLFRVQSNTITRYGLKLWDWDPGPGNGFFCYNAHHGHLPGKGGYKGWRNATALIRRIRETHPGIYLQAFYGRKEYGLWGFKHFDQHESYWEVSPVYAASLHPELHADRANADQIRQQAQWNRTFRFHPCQLSHSMTHRQQEGNWDPRLSKAWDHLGWKYSLLSTLAACGSVLVTILPEELRLVRGMLEFYERWLSWARQNYDLVPFNIPFGEQLRPGCVDGWARVKEGHGFIFLCNPNPRPTRALFGLDDEIGLAASGIFTLTELYPVERRGRGEFHAGSRVSLVVPADEVLLLELAPAQSVVSIGGDSAEIAPAARSLLPRALDEWHLPDGSRFVFPRHQQANDLVLEASFLADKRIHELLAAATPRNLTEFETLIPQWKEDYPDNFAWARPDRLWLVLPFTDADEVDGVELRLNDFATLLECHVVKPASESDSPEPRKIIYYADITDAVRWGTVNTVRIRIADLAANQFMGPFLDYPPADPIAEARAAETASVIYDGLPLDKDAVPRVPSGLDDERALPRITSVRTDPPFFREGETTRILATVNMPSEEVAEVLVSGPFWADQPMEYDDAAGAWVLEWKPPPRWRIIMDVPRHFVWAVAKNGLVSTRAFYEVDWRFGSGKG